MLNKSEIDNIILTSAKEILETHLNLDLEELFTGPSSSIDSIDIVQIISAVEQKLEDLGYEGYDFFEKTYEQDMLTFEDFSNLIEKELND